MSVWLRLQQAASLELELDFRTAMRAAWPSRPDTVLRSAASVLL